MRRSKEDHGILLQERSAERKKTIKKASRVHRMDERETSFFRNNYFWIIKLVEGLPNLLRGFREGFTIKTSIVVEGSS